MTTSEFRVPNVSQYIIVFVYNKDLYYCKCKICLVLYKSDRVSDTVGHLTGGRAPNGSNSGMQNMNKCGNKW